MKEVNDAHAQVIQSAKMSSIGQLGAGVAHELNNPLGGILGYAQFNLDKFGRPDFSIDDFKNCKKYVEFIEKEAARCKTIVQALLNFSRRPLSSKKEVLDIKNIMATPFSIIGHQITLHNIKLITDFSPDLALVLGSSNQLQQVFANLIINAQQAMPNGGQLKITAVNIIDKSTQTPNMVKIEFTDTGCGISKDNIDRVFEPFFSTKEEGKGVGLGLSVSYSIIKEHNGTKEVSSEEGRGATFIIILPVAKKYLTETTKAP